MTENADFELLDEDLKKILGHRYQDISAQFTPEAQQRRRNHRLKVTMGAAAMMMAIIIFSLWAWGIGWFAPVVAAGFIAVAGAVTGYNVGICICYNHGCWGAMV